MKAISIGRDNECDIVLNDSTDVVSRRHAVLNISRTGKMTIVDQGHNGTYINGIKISPNVPFPVTRKDVVSFAHIIQLDWKQVPNSAAQIRNIIAGVIALFIIACGATTFLVNHDNDHKNTVANTVNVAKKDSTKQDSLKKDTVKSKKLVTKKKKLIKKEEKKENNDKQKVVSNKKKEGPKKDKEVNNRTIG